MLSSGNEKFLEESKSLKFWKRFIKTLSNDMIYPRALVDVSSDCDFLAKSQLELSTLSQNTLPLIRELIQHELHKWKDVPSNIFRANSVASKLLGLYVRQVGEDYLSLSIGDLLTELVSLDISFEVDESRLLNVENPQDVISKNREHLLEWTDKFLKRIMEPKVLRLMPDEVRILASIIAQEADLLSLNTNSLLGGYIFLRFFNPAIATPEVFKLIDVRKKTKKAQRNLILITKVIQNIANQIIFASKESFMVPCNDFVKDRFDVMSMYLRKVVDTSEFDNRIEMNVLGLEEIGDTIYKYDEREIQRTYQIMYDSGLNVVTYFVTHGKESKEKYETIFRRCIEFISLLLENGNPPRLQEWKQPSDIPKVAADYCDKLLEEVWRQTLTARFPFSNSKVVYKGKPNKNGKPTYYLISSRISVDVLASYNKIGGFLNELISKMKMDLYSPFCLVIDMTYISMTVQMQEFYQTLIEDVIRAIPLEIGRNMVEIYVVNCLTTELQTWVLSTIKYMLKNCKLKNRVLKTYSDWQQLAEVIPQENIILPASTKMSRPRHYQVMTMTSKGKYIDQYIKVSPKSILVIDEKTNYIQYEKLMIDIEEISAPLSNLEIHMRVCPDILSSTGIFKNENLDDVDDVRKFCLHTLKDRQNILDDLWDTTVNSTNSKTLCTFAITKKDRKGRKVDRTLRISNDSIVIIEKRNIVEDIHFLAIDYLRMDGQDCLLLKIKGEDEQKRIWCNLADDLRASVEEGIKRCQELVKIMCTDPVCELEVYEEIPTTSLVEKITPLDSNILYLRQSVTIESVTDLIGVEIDDGDDEPPHDDDVIEI